MTTERAVRRAHTCTHRDTRTGTGTGTHLGLALPVQALDQNHSPLVRHGEVAPAAVRAAVGVGASLSAGAGAGASAGPALGAGGWHTRTFGGRLWASFFCKANPLTFTPSLSLADDGPHAANPLVQRYLTCGQCTEAFGVSNAFQYLDSVSCAAILQQECRQWSPPRDLRTSPSLSASIDLKNLEDGMRGTQNE